MYASLDSEGNVEIKKFSTEHYAGAPWSTRTTANTRSWLQRIVPGLLYVSTRTTAQDIIDIYKGLALVLKYKV